MNRSIFRTLSLAVGLTIATGAGAFAADTPPAKSKEATSAKKEHHSKHHQGNKKESKNNAGNSQTAK
jgi:hypothetical protein